MDTVNRTALILLLTAAGITAAYLGAQTTNYLEDPATCLNCHTTPINNLTTAHEEQNIQCIDCHSQPGTQGYLTARKLTATLLLTHRLTPLFNHLFQTNTSIKVNTTHFNTLQANCTKCHTPEHITGTPCNTCHTFHTPPNTTRATWERLSQGAHRVHRCIDCHQKNSFVPQCTDCHVPHNPQWRNNNTLCLNCHIDQHLPQKNATYTHPVPETLCAVCHPTPYEVLTAYNSRHNQKTTCTSCHPKHGEKLTCLNCHASHPHITSKVCSTCHGYVSACTDCHEDPHAPLSGLQRINNVEQLKNYAIQQGTK